jgi:hypothetical protein
MIISIASYNANTCGDSVNNISLFALSVNTRSTLYEIGLSRPVCKGDPTTLNAFLLVLRCGLSNLLRQLNLVGIDCLPMDFNFHPLVFRGQCGTWMLFHEHVNVRMNNFLKNVLLTTTKYLKNMIWDVIPLGDNGFFRGLFQNATDFFHCGIVFLIIDSHINGHCQLKKWSL